MANTPIQPPTAPAVPSIDPKLLGALQYLSGPEAAQIAEKQSLLLDYQLDVAREAREAREKQRELAIAARRNHAVAAKQKEATDAANEAACRHHFENGKHAIRGQRMPGGFGDERDKGRSNWVARCQMCGKRFDNKNPLPNGWMMTQDDMGGPKF